MPARWTVAVTLVLLIPLLTACGSSKGDVVLSWRAAEGTSLDVRLDDSRSHGTTVVVENDSGRTLRNATVRFRPGASKAAPIGFSVGTATSVRTEYEGDSLLWRLGDIRPNTRVVLSLGLWFTVAAQVSQAAPVTMSVLLESDSLPAAVESNSLVVQLRP